MTVKVPEKYWACQGYQLSIPLSCSLWACSEPTQKTGAHQAVLDSMLHPGHMIRVSLSDACYVLITFFKLNITILVGFGNFFDQYFFTFASL